MGLLTDIVFIKALQSDAELMRMLPAGDVYNNVADPDFDMENVAIPYLIVNNDGGSNEQGTKDDKFESGEDQVKISIRIVARTRDELARMSKRVRKAVLDYFTAAEDRVYADEMQEYDELVPYEYSFSFSDIANDMNKPAFYTMFSYDCGCSNEIIND